MDYAVANGYPATINPTTTVVSANPSAITFTDVDSYSIAQPGIASAGYIPITIDDVDYIHYISSFPNIFYGSTQYLDTPVTVTKTDVVTTDVVTTTDLVSAPVTTKTIGYINRPVTTTVADIVKTPIATTYTQPGIFYDYPEYFLTDLYYTAPGVEYVEVNPRQIDTDYIIIKSPEAFTTNAGNIFYTTSVAPATEIVTTGYSPEIVTTTYTTGVSHPGHTTLLY